MEQSKSLLRSRLVEPLATFLKQGLTPHKLALTLALGVGLSLCPFVGTTTILCTLVCFALGLNFAAIQVVNYAVFPLQLLLIVPFIQIGVLALGYEPLPFSGQEIVEWVENDPLEIIRVLWRYLALGVLVWAISLPLLVWILYKISLPLFRQIADRYAKLQTTETPE